MHPRVALSAQVRVWHRMTDEREIENFLKRNFPPFFPLSTAGQSAAMHDEHDDDPNSSEGEGEMESNPAAASGRVAGMGGGGASQLDSGDVDSKRKRRLELNRKVSVRPSML